MTYGLRKQPQNLVRLNRNHPLAIGMVSCVLGSNPRIDLITGTTNTITGGPSLVGRPRGKGPGLNGTNQAIGLGRKFMQANGSILLLASSVSTTGGSATIAGQTSDNAGNNNGLGWQGGLFRVAGIGVSVGTLSGELTLAGTWGSLGIRAFVNGNQVGFNASTTGPSSAVGNYFFEFGCFSYQGGRIFWHNSTPLFFACWDRALTDAEIRDISENPYQIFERQDHYEDYIPTGGTVHTLVGSNCSQSNNSTAAAIAQRHKIVASNSSQANGSAVGSLTQRHALAGSTSSQSCNSSAGAIGQRHKITGSGSSQSNSSSTSSIGQRHKLLIANSSQSNLSSVGALGAVVIQLAGSPCSQANTSWSGPLTQHHKLAGSTSSQSNNSSVGAIHIPIIVTLGGSNCNQSNSCSNGAIVVSDPGISDTNRYVIDPIDSKYVIDSIDRRFVIGGSDNNFVV